MKLLISFLFFIISISSGYTYNLSEYYKDDIEMSIEFSNDIFVLKNNFDGSEISGNYYLQKTDNVSYFIYTKDGQIKNKWLILYSDVFLMLFDENGKCFFSGYTYLSHHTQHRKFSKYKATSFLTENNLKYEPDNLGDINLSKPWVENAEGYGIGEKISLSVDQTMDPCKYLIISNGYISYKNPILFDKNGRVKKMALKNDENNFYQIVSLRDSPNPQLVTLSEPQYDITIEIIEVYEGEKYSDTCINFILYLPEDIDFR